MIKDGYLKVRRYVTKGVKKTYVEASFLLMVLTTIMYRCMIIRDYVSKIIDEDQALMWYGTVMASRFEIKEPHFLGQAYGSMIESIVAAPFYMIGIPLQYAMPVATFILWYSPFVLIYIFLRNKNAIWAILVLVVPMINNWNYDLLTSIPRSFIPGFVIATIGIILMVDINQNRYFRFLMSFLFMAIGYVHTETTITVSALAVLYVLLYDFNNVVENFKILVMGVVFSVLIIYFCNYYFYDINPEFLLHGGATQLNLSFDVLKLNLEKNIIDTLNTFSFVKIGDISLTFVLWISSLICLLIRHELKFVIINICACIGTVLFFSLGKTMDFADELLFSQARMFLFVPYIFAEILLFSGLVFNEMKVSFMLLRAITAFITLIFIIISTWKCLYFENVVLAKECLYKSEVINTCKVNSIYKTSNEISQMVKEYDCDVVVILSDSRLIGYASGAINNDQYLSYNAFYDRRTNTYINLKDNNIVRNVLLVSFIGNDISSFETVCIHGDIIEWLKRNRGLERRPL